jgi:phospholipid N-methyltransferase
MMKGTSERIGMPTPGRGPIADGLLFAGKFLRSPRTVGSIMPSSRQLARRMLAPIDWTTATAVAELGAGTGVFTRMIRERKRPGCTALILEKDDGMRRQLAARYPELHVGGDARELTRIMERCGIRQLDAVVCGLPFANFPQDLRDAIMDQVEAALKPGGVFVCFQYSLQMRKQLAARFGRVEIRFVPLNVPFAFVYVCRKRGNHDAG